MEGFAERIDSFLVPLVVTPGDAIRLTLLEWLGFFFVWRSCLCWLGLVLFSFHDAQFTQKLAADIAYRHGNHGFGSGSYAGVDDFVIFE